MCCTITGHLQPQTLQVDELAKTIGLKFRQECESLSASGPKGPSREEPRGVSLPSNRPFLEPGFA